MPQTSTNANYVASTPWGFGEGYTDGTGLLYLIHRYYDPGSGQFVSVDPALSQTEQPYAYANDDPLNMHDPSGLWTLGVCLQFSAIAEIPLQFSGFGCIDREETGGANLGRFMVEGGGGLALAAGEGASLSSVIEAGSASQLDSMGGWFANIGVSSVPGAAGGTAGVFQTLGGWVGHPGTVFGAYFGLSTGLNYSASIGLTYTWLWRPPGWIASLIGRWWNHFFQTPGHYESVVVHALNVLQRARQFWQFIDAL